MKIKHLDRYKKGPIESYNRWHTYDRNIWSKLFRNVYWMRWPINMILRITPLRGDCRFYSEKEIMKFMARAGRLGL